jgi:hypothetical protein
MVAYIVFTPEIIHEPSEDGIHAQENCAGMTSWPVVPDSIIGRNEMLEGVEIKGAVIVQFPTVEAAKAYYDNPVCREAGKYFFKGGNYHAVIVEGADRVGNSNR